MFVWVIKNVFGIELIFQKGLTLIKQINQKNVCFINFLFKWVAQLIIKETDAMLNRAKEYCKDNKEIYIWRKETKIKEYQKNYRKAKKIIIYTGKKNNELICEL